MLRSTHALLLAAGLALASAPAVAATCDGVEFADRISAGGADLVLNGLGLRKATIFAVKVYVAGLYLPEHSGDPAAILASDRAWRLVLHFVRDVDASDMHEAFQEGFAKAGADLGAMQPRIDALAGMLVDFEVGQRLGFASDPGKGLEVDVDSTTRGTVAGADFATGLLTIWLGPEPPNEDLKSGLLGGACE
jgi:hypothetical protein